ncbi:MAG TPA: NAD(P)/FAD-dependent oxidoreductase [Actinomycetota bacterium]|jgi:phytoene dehydrogenase-like protein
MGTPSHNRYDTIVIGAGHNGLTAAAYLARAGLSTVVLERREQVGGCCVTEEIAPGCRASTTSYIASMLRPEVIRDLRLGPLGLRMVPCEPGLQVPFLDGEILPWWSDNERTAAEIERFSARDARTFLSVDAQLKKLARYLQPYFLEPPPDVHARGLGRAREAIRHARRFRTISGDEVGQMVAFLTGSLGDYLDRTFESDRVRTMYVANNVYGKHGGPYQPGTAIGLLFHLLSGGDEGVQGFYGHVIGGMGSITQAMATAVRGFGGEIVTEAPVARVDVESGRARGVVLEDGTQIAASTVLSGADPKRTFLGLVDKRELPEDFRTAIAGIKMDGPCAKVNFVLSREPLPVGMPKDADPVRRSLFTLLESPEFAERCYDTAKHGEIPEQLWVDCVVASSVDPTLAPPGSHVMTSFVQFVPYRLHEGTWDQRRDLLGDRVVAKISEYVPGFADTIVARQVLTPLDLERTYGLTEGNIFHGDLTLDQLFFNRPVPGWARYRSPVDGLYLCGAGAHPGGGVTGAPGYNAAHQVLRDRKRRRA